MRVVLGICFLSVCSLTTLAAVADRNHITSNGRMQVIKAGPERGHEMNLKLSGAGKSRGPNAPGTAHVRLPWLQCQKQPPSESAMLQAVKGIYRCGFNSELVCPEILLAWLKTNTFRGHFRQLCPQNTSIMGQSIIASSQLGVDARYWGDICFCQTQPTIVSEQ